MNQRVDTAARSAAGQARFLAKNASYLIATAARAPSVHNSQPWQFRVTEDAVELWSDPQRKLRTDPIGREMMISCGAALFGLRLAVRSLGYQLAVELLPDPAQLRLLARVTIGTAEPMNVRERQMLAAVPHRHTHRGPFASGPLPAGLLPGLQHDALAEGAELALIGDGLPYERLALIVADAARRGDRDPQTRAEVRKWTRDPSSTARDGVPATSLAARAPGRLPHGQLRQRAFDLGRDLARPPTRADEDEVPPVATAVLLTPGDRRADWLRAGQALQRLLLHAASTWVFASLYTQPLEDAVTRALIREKLTLPGNPQMLLQLGRAASTASTARRPPSDLAP
jgi:nitroreductase